MICISLSFIIVTFANGQVSVTGDIRAEITSIINAMPNDTAGNDFVRPTVSQLATWERAFTLLINGNYADAEDTANLLAYSLTAFTDTSEGFSEVLYMLKDTGAKYWGTYIINPTFCKPLVIQAPHPKFDFNTGKQGVYVFRKTDGYAFMMSGAHRCNSSTFSSCAGTTGVCAASTEAYRISDPAHYDSNFFHFATKLLFNTFSATYFVQLHGFTKLGGDPYVIMSNGTRDTPTIDYLDILDNKLYDEDNVLTFKLVHIDTSWTRLTGFSNTQGRFINQSGNPCSTSPSSTTGRFLHIEQEKNELRATEAGWAKMANALNNTFSCGGLPIQLLQFEGVKTSAGNLIKWTTATETNNAWFYLERSDHGLMWRNIYQTEGVGNSTSLIAYNFLDQKPGNRKLYYRLQQEDFDGTMTTSRSIAIAANTESYARVYPNPADHWIDIELPNTNVANVSIYNHLGALQQAFQFSGRTNRLNITEWIPGIYSIQIMVENRQQTLLLMVQ